MSLCETPSRIEPAYFEDDVPRVLADLVADLQTEAHDLGNDLHAIPAEELAELVRLMNCYYSNLIEGHATRPRDIERALADQPVDPERRPLAQEARAHVLVQREIDALHRDGRLPSPTSIAFLSWVHRRFYEEMPPEFRTVRMPDGSDRPIVPGAFRSTAGDDVEVGRHRPPSSDRVGDFMTYFERRYGMARGGSTRIIAIAAAHHRLNYVHPFIDGNGRVSRLMSHAMALDAGIGGHGLWSLSRGLARGLRDRNEYKSMMDMADSPRRGDRDGRGNLSQEALRDFCAWTLTVMIDQVRFTKAAFRLDALEGRYRRLLRDLGHDARAEDLVAAVLKVGEMERGQARIYLATSDRTARNVLSKLVSEGFLKSGTPKGPVRVAFPLDYRERLFPNLFTDAPIEVPKPPPFRIP
ncbi:Fic family protein [Methylobacterium sp. J-076]|uniref:Fic family protein n=1 Tax=Methylobacterium sp. J-076 TaxID=2836655 RepID=UPI001FBA96C8|nr:Fic family protein [Methylobacterium sp. J-076]MCJ2011278.1 Fic family protein [Methylobacterium sp. J-076]